MPKIKTPRDDILDEAEVVETLKNCYELEVQAAICVMWITGCRVGELVLLKFKDLKDKQKYVEINMPTLKQRKTVLPRRTVLFPKNNLFYTIFKNYVNSIHPKFADRQLFECSPHHIWFMMKKANPNIYPHLFRHSRATILSNDIDIFDLKYAFGWASMDMPQRYVHRKNSPERIYRAISGDTEKLDTRDVSEISE